MATPITFTVEDLKTPDRLERVLRQFQNALDNARAAAPVLPDLNALTALLAPRIRDELQSPGGTPLNLQSLLPAQGQSVVLEDTHANRLTLYPATNYSVGTVFYETDRTVIYAVVNSSGALVWQYVTGIYVDVAGNQPADLVTTDSGFRFHSTTTTQRFRWTGSAFIEDYELTDAATVTITTMLLLKHLTSGAAGVGFGLGEVLQLENAGNAAITALYRTVEWVVATAGAESSLWRQYLMNGGALTEVLSQTNAGHLQLSIATALMRFGGATNAFPAFKRNGVNTQSRLADDSATTDHEVADEVYGAGWNGSVEVPTKNAVYDKIESLPTSTTASGVYTPTLTNVANLDASTAYECQYLQVGSTVVVSGKVDIDPTLAATITQLGISLPVASNLGAAEDCGGSAFASGIAGQGAAIRADAANDRAEMVWRSGDITNQPMYFCFAYQVI